MYILARHVGEEIVIADIIRLKVLSITGNIVRIGFEAPQEVSIKRVEKSNDPVGEKTRKD